MTTKRKREKMRKRRKKRERRKRKRRRKKKRIKQHLKGRGALEVYLEESSAVNFFLLVSFNMYYESLKKTQRELITEQYMIFNIIY